ncbi:MAG: radical SAM protein [Deltaproteobacteria bacterium]|nr:radical SAM protein [Deltaproteobacteria bacterium]
MTTRLLLVETCSAPRPPRDALTAEHGLRWSLALEELVDRRGGRRRHAPRDGRGGVLSLFGIPLGAAFLAGALRDRDVEVLHEPLILAARDGRSPRQALVHAVARQRPHVVGLTANHTVEEGVTLEFARAVKETNPATRVVVGGTHATFRATALARSADIDAVLRFEGEASLPAWLETLDGRRSPSDVPGLVARVDGRLVEVPPGPPLDFARAMPDYGPLHAERYAQAGILAHVQTSRGCPHGCPFCAHAAFWGPRVRHRDAGLVADEVQLLSELGCDLFYLTDSTFSEDRERVRELCDTLARRGADRPVHVVETRLDRLDDEVLGWLARGGVGVVVLGVETAAPEVLEGVPGKRSADPVRAAREAVWRIRAHGMRAYVSLALGLPGETAETLAATERLVEQLYADGDGLLWADAKLARAFPGTPLAREPERFHAVVDPRYEGYDFYSGVTLHLERGAAAERILETRRRIMERNVRAWRERRAQDADRVARGVARMLGTEEGMSCDAR